MTTTVLVGIQGNKACKMTGPNGDAVMMPGTWTTLTISGDNVVTVSELGDVIAAPSGIAIKALVDAAVDTAVKAQLPGP